MKSVRRTRVSIKKIVVVQQQQMNEFESASEPIRQPTTDEKVERKSLKGERFFIFDDNRETFSILRPSNTFYTFWVPCYLSLVIVKYKNNFRLSFFFPPLSFDVARKGEKKVDWTELWYSESIFYVAGCVVRISPLTEQQNNGKFEIFQLLFSCVCEESSARFGTATVEWH